MHRQDKTKLHLLPGLMQKTKNAVIIVSAGSGTRAAVGRSDALPKQYQDLSGQPIAAYSIDQFARHSDIDLIVLVIRPSDREFVETNIKYATQPHVIIQDGGKERDQSVRMGLARIPDDFDNVLIHDAARPLVCEKIISDVLNALQHTPGAAPALPVTDALWYGSSNQVEASKSRQNLWRAQTPQGFHLQAIRQAHANCSIQAADDVEVARTHGLEIRIVPGSEDNIKITHPEDFARAELLLNKNRTAQMDIRTGNGYDVHKFGTREDGANDYVTLCGIQVPHTTGLLGHSDADVGMHAITDAIYGALAEGDIGRHFPPSEAEWKNADSRIFLKHAVDLAQGKGFSISNIDCTLVCEFPKIGPVADKMRHCLAEITGLDLERISVKATTSEKLGFTGRGEGIASIATTTLIKL